MIAPHGMPPARQHVCNAVRVTALNCAPRPAAVPKQAAQHIMVFANRRRVVAFQRPGLRRTDDGEKRRQGRQCVAIQASVALCVQRAGVRRASKRACVTLLQRSSSMLRHQPEDKVVE